LAIAKDGDVGWQSELDKRERMDDSGEAWYSLRLWGLGFDSCLKPGLRMDFGDDSWKP
jgi:hypothetical protein